MTGQPQKFKRRYQNFTPAMKMGLTSTQLKWRDLIIAPIAENAHEFSTSTVTVGWIAIGGDGLSPTLSLE